MSDSAPPPQEPTPPTGEGAAGASAGPTVGLATRFAARLIDGLIVALTVALVLFALPGIGPGSAVGSVVSSLAYLAYFVYFEGTTGETLGKRMLSLRVVAEDGHLSFDRAFRRNWWAGLGIFGVIPFIGFLASLASLAIVIWIAVTIARDDRDQGWHDELASTLVVRTG